jgi:hypothetical protein
MDQGRGCKSGAAQAPGKRAKETAKDGLTDTAVDEEHPLKDLGSEVIVVLRVRGHGELVLGVVTRRDTSEVEQSIIRLARRGEREERPERGGSRSNWEREKTHCFSRYRRIAAVSKTGKSYRSEQSISTFHQLEWQVFG